METIRPDLVARMNATGIPYKIYASVLDETAAIQFAECLEAPGVVQAALMADAHGGYVAPIGSVIAVEDKIYPSFVGYDIGCGMSEAKLDVKVDGITKNELTQIRDEILKRIPIGFNRHKKKQPLSKELRAMPMTKEAKKVLDEQGGSQIGTLGGGNHFLELGSTKDGYLSIVVHSGSRGVGHKIATHHMKIAAVQNTDHKRYELDFDTKNEAWKAKIMTMKPSPKLDNMQDAYDAAKKEFVYRRTRARVDNIEGAHPLDTSTPEGRDYINDMNMALHFALDNREFMIENVRRSITTITGQAPDVLRFVNRNHNHADYKEVPTERTIDYPYGYKPTWIHRKGATHAEDGMLGVIPGNMVDGSFIVKGKGNPDSMYSSSHGAGRVLSRSKAKKTLNLEEFQECTKHLVANHSDSNLDEAPSAYKNIYEVMELQKDLVEVIDQVTPILNIKG